MNPTSKPQHASGRTRRFLRTPRFLAATVAALALAALPGPTRAEEPSAGGAPAFREVGRLPIELGSGADAVAPGLADQSGWLVLDRRTRRAYEVFETSGDTVIQSFDLDTLAPRRRAKLSGVTPVYGGPRAGSNAGGSSGAGGEIVHAVDEEAGRFYLAVTDFVGDLSRPIAFNSFSADANRAVTRYVVIDEAAFDDPANARFSASIPEPAQPVAWLRSLVVDRTHGTDGGTDAVGRPVELGRLVSIVTLPNVASLPPGAHLLRQWKVGQVDFTLGVGTAVDAVAPVPLSVCAGSSMTTGVAAQGNYQWGLLMTPDGAYLGCQATQRSARAVFVGLDAGGIPTGQQLAYPLSRPVTDVLVDGGGGRLLFRSAGAGGGQTWWVFDTHARRFAGALAAVLSDDRFGVGIDETTGRLYMLVPDYVATDHGRAFGVRGGLETADTRLDPVPPAEDVAPELAYPAVFRIQVDPATRRVFVRRGAYGANIRYVYPAVQPSEPSPVEPHYLVLRDERAVPVQPVEGPGDDRRFTADVEEADGLTKASYQASGSGYGARTLLVGGFGAATDRTASDAVAPDCDKDDRELSAGSVESAALSDLSAAAGAASLAGDSRTEEQAGTLPAACNQDHGAQAPPTGELEFDRTGGPGGKPDGRSDFRTQCVGDEDPKAQRPPPSEGPGPDRRKEFSADVDCHQGEEAVEAAATGSLATPAAAVGEQQAPVVTVGHAESKVTVERRRSGGVVVHVDSIARDVVIGGIGRIGVVRAEATSEAAGRDGTAKATFTRTVCGVDLPGVPDKARCLDELALAQLEDAFASQFSGQVELRFRDPEEKLLRGSISGFRAGVQRKAVDLFQDASISKDTSLAVPGMELVFFRGDDSQAGAGRQIVQLAGVQAGTSYGIACLYGQATRSTCATGPGEGSTPPPTFGGGTSGTDGNDASGAFATGGTGASRGKGGGLLGTLARLAKAPFRIAADVARLLFSNPREFGLMASVWALLYLPCWLGERRRTLAGLAARRAATGRAA